MPAVMVEVVDLANPEDQLKLDDDKYLNRLADAIALAVGQYMKTKEGRSGGKRARR